MTKFFNNNDNNNNNKNIETVIFSILMKLDKQLFTSVYKRRIVNVNVYYGRYQKHLFVH